LQHGKNCAAFRSATIANRQNVSHYSVTIEFNGTTRVGKYGQLIAISALRGRKSVSKQRQTRSDIGDCPRCALGVGEYCSLADIFNLLAGDAIKACKRRPRRYRAYVELRIALAEIALFRHAFVHCQAVGYANHPKRANQYDEKRNEKTRPPGVDCAPDCHHDHYQEQRSQRTGHRSRQHQ
jgi:hypothetical protein